MLERKEIEEIMRKRGYTVYATINKNILQFVSSHMYDYARRKEMPEEPIINVIVNLETRTFRGTYNLDCCINFLGTPECSPVTDDKHFSRIINDRLIKQAKILIKGSV